MRSKYIFIYKYTISFSPFPIGKRIRVHIYGRLVFMVGWSSFCLLSDDRYKFPRRGHHHRRRPPPHFTASLTIGSRGWPPLLPRRKEKIYSHLIKRVHLWLYWDRHLPFFMDTTSTFSSISGVIYDTRKISYERVDRKREKERGLPTGCERGQMSETLKRKE